MDRRTGTNTFPLTFCLARVPVDSTKHEPEPCLFCGPEVVCLVAARLLLGAGGKVREHRPS